MTRKVFLFSSWLVLVVAAAAAVAYVYRTLLPQDSSGAHVPPVPVLSMPSVLNLGEQEQHQVVLARFAVANRGGADLVLDRFRMSCACNGLEREQGGRFVPVEVLRLAPQEQTEVVLRVAARAPAGAGMQNTITFRTNDPACAEASLTALITKVTGGIQPSPTAVMFGTVPVGREVKATVDVYDSAIRARSIKYVESSDKELLTARLLDAGQGPKRNPDDGSSVLIGRIEVVLNAGQPAKVDGAVRVFLNEAGRPPDLVPVTARVAALVEASPSSLVLPRMSGTGPVYFADFLCRTSTGELLDLTLSEAHPGVTVTISGAEEARVRVVRVNWNPPQDAKPIQAHEEVVRLRARVGVEVAEVKVPVLLSSGREH